jgi:HEAT repeat protein
MSIPTAAPVRTHRTFKWLVAAAGILVCLALVYRDSWVRCQVVACSGSVFGRHALPYLLGSLRDADLHVHNEAVETLKRIGEPAVPGLVRAVENASTRRETRVDIVSVLSALGERAPGTSPTLLRLLKDSDPTLRGVSVTALGFVPCDDGELRDALLSMMDDPITNVRLDVLQLAGTVTSTGRIRTTTPIFLRMLNDDESEVRTVTADIMGKLLLDDAAITAALEQLQNDPNPDVQSEVEEALQVRRRRAERMRRDRDR